jgi:hypothetical protein
MVRFLAVDDNWDPAPRFMAAKTAQWVHSQMACLRNHGAVLGDLTDWVVRQWAGETGRFSASSIILDNACGP